MIWLYRILFFPALLVLLPRYLLRMRRRGGYAAHFGNRFGSYGALPAKPLGGRRIWLQAVSVGEMLAIEPILKELAKDGTQIFLTTTTSTGYQLAEERYRPLIAGLGYFPVDWWGFSARAWHHIAPDLAIVTEGERWPEHVRQARRHGIALVNINARMSDRSFRRLERWRKWLPGVPGLLLADVTRLLACSEQDGIRFKELGYPANHLTVTGNIKLDVAIPILDEAARLSLRKELGLPAGFVLLGSSTWEGEEEALISSFLRARKEGLACSLLLVPRHAERRLGIEQRLQASGLRYHFRSKGAATAQVEVAVGDTTGELRNFTQLADLVFVGKSLPPHSLGQTPVEAAALGKPILFGPGMGNFAVISRDLVARGAARQVADSASLSSTVLELLGDSAKREALAKAASAWRSENSGAAARTVAVIRDELKRS